MTISWKIKTSKKEVSQKIKLKEVFGRDLRSGEKEAFFDAALDRILERTQDEGKTIHGDSFEQYSKEYAKKKGVSRSDVDMTLFGDMLLDINDGSRQRNSVKLQIDDPDEAIKAFAHLTGYEGHPKIKNGKKREFFGLSDSEIQDIANNVKGSSGQSDSNNQTISNTDRVLLGQLLTNLGIEFGDNS